MVIYNLFPWFAIGKPMVVGYHHLRKHPFLLQNAIHPPTALLRTRWGTAESAWPPRPSACVQETPDARERWTGSPPTVERGADLEDIRVFPKKMGFPPKSSHFNRVFHYFHHPFWGTTIFGNTHTWNSTTFRSVDWKLLPKTISSFRK